MKYRAERAKVYQLTNSQRPLLVAVEKVLAGNVADMESLLTCLAISEQLNSQHLTEQALNVILNALADELAIVDVQLLLKTLPNILTLNYPIITDIRNLAINHMEQLIRKVRLNRNWQRYSELNFVRQLLRSK